MALAADGQISLGDINAEGGRTRTTADTRLKGLSDGTHFTVNTDSDDRPDGNAPYNFTKWRSYDHSASGSSVPSGARPYIFAEDFVRNSTWHATSKYNFTTAGETFASTSWSQSGGTGDHTFGTAGTADAAGNYTTGRPAYESDGSGWYEIENTSPYYLDAGYGYSSTMYEFRYGPNEGFPANENITDSLNVHLKGADYARNSKQGHVHLELSEDTNDTTGSQYSGGNEIIFHYAAPAGAKYHIGVTKRDSGTNTLVNYDGGSSGKYNIGSGAKNVQWVWNPNASSAPYLECYVDSDIGGSTPTITYSDTFFAGTNHNNLYGMRFSKSGSSYRYAGHLLYHTLIWMS